MPTNSGETDRSSAPWEEEEAEAAEREAAAIGGRAGDEELDPAQRPLVEAGEGVAEGFELAEEELINAAQHGDSGADPSRTHPGPRSMAATQPGNTARQTTRIPPRSLTATDDRRRQTVSSQPTASRYA